MNEADGQLHTLSVVEQLREASKAYGTLARKRTSASMNFCDS
jgi:hypothetical protein